MLHIVYMIFFDIFDDYNINFWKQNVFNVLPQWHTFIMLKFTDELYLSCRLPPCLGRQTRRDKKKMYLLLYRLYRHTNIKQKITMFGDEENSVPRRIVYRIVGNVTKFLLLPTPLSPRKKSSFFCVTKSRRKSNFFSEKSELCRYVFF